MNSITYRFLCISKRLCYSNLKLMDTSLYFHIPFCRRRCGYCDFNTYAGMENFICAYVKALKLEIEQVLSNSPEQLDVSTIYFGGGTPSMLDVSNYEDIFSAIKKFVNIAQNAEISLEANPDTLSKEKIIGFQQAGFNRISIGMQSASRFDLQTLDRVHSNQSLINSVDWCRRAGLTNINLDLIFGIPSQTLQSWEQTLKLALGLGVPHFSLYSLILEWGTRLKAQYDRGLLAWVDDDLAADMYELAMEKLEKAGYDQYEISNWANGQIAFCRHNLQYWRYLPYLGFGAGAHGFCCQTRTENTHTIEEYINSINTQPMGEFPAGPASSKTFRLNQWEMMQENLMVSLRLTEEGISLPVFFNRYGIDLAAVFAKQLERLMREGLIEFYDNEKRMRLTRKGRLFGNRVFRAFVSNDVPVGYEYLLNQ